jgi:hypothetical protein
VARPVADAPVRRAAECDGTAARRATVGGKPRPSGRRRASGGAATRPRSSFRHSPRRRTRPTDRPSPGSSAGCFRYRRFDADAARVTPAVRARSSAPRRVGARHPSEQWYRSVGDLRLRTAARRRAAGHLPPNRRARDLASPAGATRARAASGNVRFAGHRRDALVEPSRPCRSTQDHSVEAGRPCAHCRLAGHADRRGSPEAGAPHKSAHRRGVFRPLGDRGRRRK